MEIDVRNQIHSRHAVGSGIHGEWSADQEDLPDEPIKPIHLVMCCLVYGALFLAMCIGAAEGY